MQLTLGRRWVVEFQIRSATRNEIESACYAVRRTIERKPTRREAVMRWELDNTAGKMLSGWDRHLQARARKGSGRCGDDVRVLEPVHHEGEEQGRS
jgi:hypothetical protein